MAHALLARFLPSKTKTEPMEDSEDEYETEGDEDDEDDEEDEEDEEDEVESDDSEDEYSADCSGEDQEVGGCKKRRRTMPSDAADTAGCAMGERQPCVPLNIYALLCVFSYLDVQQDLAAASAVCREWHAAARSPALWKERTIGLYTFKMALSFFRAAADGRAAYALCSESLEYTIYDVHARDANDACEVAGQITACVAKTGPVSAWLRTLKGLSIRVGQCVTKRRSAEFSMCLSPHQSAVMNSSAIAIMDKCAALSRLEMRVDSAKAFVAMKRLCARVAKVSAHGNGISELVMHGYYPRSFGEPFGNNYGRAPRTKAFETFLAAIAACRGSLKHVVLPDRPGALETLANTNGVNLLSLRMSYVQWNRPVAACAFGALERLEIHGLESTTNIGPDLVAAGKTVKTLVVEDFNIARDNVDEDAFLANFTELERLTLSFCSFNMSRAQIAARPASDLPSLSAMHRLSDVDMDFESYGAPFDVAATLEHIASANAPLRRLKLSLTAHIDADAAARAVGRLFPGRLEWLIIEGNDITECSAREACAAIDTRAAFPTFSVSIGNYFKSPEKLIAGDSGGRVPIIVAQAKHIVVTATW